MRCWERDKPSESASRKQREPGDKGSLLFAAARAIKTGERSALRSIGLWRRGPRQSEATVENQTPAGTAPSSLCSLDGTALACARGSFYAILTRGDIFGFRAALNSSIRRPELSARPALAFAAKQNTGKTQKRETQIWIDQSGQASQALPVRKILGLELRTASGRTRQASNFPSAQALRRHTAIPEKAREAAINYSFANFWRTTQCGGPILVRKISPW